MQSIPHAVALDPEVGGQAQAAAGAFPAKGNLV